MEYDKRSISFKLFSFLMEKLVKEGMTEAVFLRG